jgi:probable HAF family extracellular repeat protein
MNRLSLGLFTITAAGLLAPWSAAQIVFTPIGDLPGGSSTVASELLGVSGNGGVAVGYAVSTAGYEAVRWTQAGGMVSLGDFAGGATTAYGRAASNDGAVVAGAGTSASGTEMLTWTAAGGLVNRGDPAGGSVNAVAYAISANGDVIAGAGNNGSTVAFRWTAGGGFQSLGFLPGGGSNTSQARGISADGSVIVGFSSSSTGSGQEAFRWTASGGMVGLGLLPGGIYTSQANAISANGAVVVGSSFNSRNVQEAFRWTAAGGMVGLGELAGGNDLSMAYGASSDGSVVVGYTGVAGGNAAFFWTADAGMRSLQDYLTGQGVDLTGWTLRNAWGVSDDGTTIVGSGLHNGMTEGFIVSGLNLTAIPEPSTSAATAGLLTFAALGWSRRRQRTEAPTRAGARPGNI